MNITHFSSFRFICRRAAILAFVFLLLAGGRTADAQTNPQPYILFLHLKVTRQAVSLVESNLRPGLLKPGLEADTTGLSYELVSEAGTALWKGSMADPNLRHLEYEDPANPGKLLRKSVQLDEAEFTLRVPFHQAARRINFFRLATGGAGAAQLAVARTSLGSITLPLNQQRAR